MTIPALSSSPIVSELELPVSGPPADPEPLLPAPSTANVDIGLALATLSIDSAFERRKSARELKNQSERALSESESAQLANMEESAEQKLSSARLAAVGETAAGVLSIAGACVALKSPNVAGSSLEVGKGASSLTSGTFKLLSSKDESDASEADVRAKAAEQAAGHFRDRFGDAKDEIDATHDTVSKAIDFLKEYESSQSQTAAATLHRA